MKTYIENTEDKLIDVLDDRTIFVRERLEFNYPTITKKQRYMLLAKNGKIAEIIIDTEINDMEDDRRRRINKFNETVEGSPFVFEECTFILVQFDATEVDTSIFPSVFNVKTSSKVEFIDCSFMGIVKNRVSKYRIPTIFTLFRNISPDHHLVFNHCFFQNLKSVYDCDDVALSLEFDSCYFEGIYDIAVNVFHPYQLLFNKCNFFNVMDVCIEVSLDNSLDINHKDETFVMKAQDMSNRLEFTECNFSTCHDGIIINSDKISGGLSGAVIRMNGNKLSNISKNGITFENIFVHQPTVERPTLNRMVEGSIPS